MYPNQIHNIKKNVNIDFIKLVFNYNGITNLSEKIEQLNSCTTCFNLIKQRKLIYVYNNFGDIPRVINAVIECNNYYLINKLCLITMYCKTLNTTSYSYLHQNGNPKMFQKNFKNFMGSIGLIYDEDTIDNKTFTEDSKIKIIEAIKWLKTYNDLFKKYLCNYEKIINYLISINPQSLHLGTPILLKDHMKTIEVLNDSGNFQME